MKKYWFELTAIAIFVLTVGFYIGVQIKSIQSNDEIKQLKNEVAKAYDKGYSDGEKYIEQIVDDFELVIELQQYYYQENITTHSFGDWLQINYPELYKRIESYF